MRKTCSHSYSRKSGKRNSIIHIQEKVEKEIRSLIDRGHIVRLEKSSDPHFISPIVITVKKDQSKKLAMDSKQIKNR